MKCNYSSQAVYDIIRKADQLEFIRMSLQLLAEYGSSSDEESSDDNIAHDNLMKNQEEKKSNAGPKSNGLPSAAELFSATPISKDLPSVDQLFSLTSPFVAKKNSKEEMPKAIESKRKVESDEVNVKSKKQVVNRLLPPQLLRPNVITEDFNAWNNKSKSNAGKKETYSEKEKRKRDNNQSSRGKSYVEEEKRILREAGH